MQYIHEYLFQCCFFKQFSDHFIETFTWFNVRAASMDLQIIRYEWRWIHLS